MSEGWRQAIVQQFIRGLQERGVRCTCTMEARSLPGTTVTWAICEWCAVIHAITDDTDICSCGSCSHGDDLRPHWEDL